MNAVSRTGSENIPVKSYIPVPKHLLKSRIPVPAQASNNQKINHKAENVSKKFSVSTQPPLNAKKTTLAQKPCVSTVKSQIEIKSQETQPLCNRRITLASKPYVPIKTLQNEVKLKKTQPLNSRRTTLATKPCVPIGRVTEVKPQKAASSNKAITNFKPVQARKKHILNENIKNSKLGEASKTETASSDLSQTSEGNSKNYDLKKVEDKENKNPVPDHLASQKDIKFEANEFYRNLILSDRELSPSILKLQPEVKLSTVRCERPSAYKKFHVVADPKQEALRELQRLTLSRKKNKVSSVKRESKPPLPGSPFKMLSIQRQSFYTPCSDPKKELVKSLQEFQERRLLKQNKSSKKVSFNLNVIEYCSPKAFSNRVQTPFRSAENELAKINEESSLNSPQSNSAEAFPLTSTQQSDPQTSECDKTEESSSTLCSLSKPSSVTQQNCTETQHKITVFDNSDLSTPMTKVSVISSVSHVKENTKVSNCSDTLEDNKRKQTDIILNSSRKLDCSVSSADFFYDNMRGISLNREIRKSLFTSVSKTVVGQDLINSNQAKIYTPRPVSFYLNSRTYDSSSPEFLVNEADRRLSQYAPICTPLVLKSLARSPESPEATSVRLKLDFAEDEKEDPKESISKSTQVIPLFNLQNIETVRKKQEKLADEECHLLLMNENTFPFVCGRYLWNPVARILSEGDEMHFIPIAF